MSTLQKGFKLQASGSLGFLLAFPKSHTCKRNNSEYLKITPSLKMKCSIIFCYIWFQEQEILAELHFSNMFSNSSTTMYFLLI